MSEPLSIGVRVNIARDPDYFREGRGLHIHDAKPYVIDGDDMKCYKCRYKVKKT